MITSSSNAQIKNITALQKLSRERKRQGLFVAEGRKMCLEAPRHLMEKLYVTESYMAENPLEEFLGVPLEVVKDSVFHAMAETKTPQGILALMKREERTLSDVLSGLEEAPLLLALENLQDPGNLGTIVRSAEGAGVSAILLSPGCVDIYAPKVTRSTMGSLFRVPFVLSEDFPGDLNELKRRGITRYAAVLEKSRVYTEPDYQSPCAFLIGNEGNGLTREAVAAADERIRIPMGGKLESLNASVAASLLIYEARRQRTNGENRG